MCCTQAKLALPLGGTPYRQRASSARRSPPQSETLKGGLASIKSALRSGILIVMEAVPVGDLPLDATYGEVHFREPPSRVVRLLAVDADIAARPSAVAAGMRVDELDRLYGTCPRSRSKDRRRGPGRVPASRPGA